MLEHIIETFLPYIISLLEIFGISIILIGAVKSFVFYCLKLINKGKYNIRLELGSALELGLEYKMGAEILKTVLVRDMSEIWILGAIVLLRALLSLLLHFELKAEAQEKK